jgi:hypothetical protein
MLSSVGRSNFSGMNAYLTPAGAGRETSGPWAPDRRDWLRLVGGVMIGAGALVLLIRKQSDWGNWAIFAALLIPAILLIGVGVAPGTRRGVQGWQSAFLVFGTLLLLGALIRLVTALDGNPRASLNIAWTFGVAGAVAFATSLALRARVQTLLGAALWLVTWLALWDKILSNPSGNTVRWLLIALAAIYVLGAVLLTRAGRSEGSDLITVAGVAAVIAGALSFAAAAQSVSVSSSLTGSAPRPGQGWNVFLLVVSLLLIAYGSRSVTRGPAYVGAFGLAAFIGLTGADLVTRLNGDPGGGVVGWPLILLIGGAAALVLSFVLRPGSLGSADGDGALGSGGPGAYGAPGQTQTGAPSPPGPPAAQAQTQVGGQAQPGAPAQPPPPPGAPPPGQQGEQWRQQPPPGSPPQQ